MNYTEAYTENDLVGILSLQSQNLEKNVSPTELNKQGFLTVEHNLETLRSISGSFHHVIAKNGQDQICGYTLVMLREYSHQIPVLISMFDTIQNLKYNGKALSETKYFIMGQVCVAKEYRGKGVFANLYDHLSHSMQAEYDYIITEVANRNQRSLHAHYKSGFKTIHEYTSELGEEWSIVLREI